MKNIRIFNSDPQKIFDSNYISFYKGVPVIRTNMLDGFAGASFGIILIDDDSKLHTTVQHEYGHSVQLFQLGLIDYTVFVAAPSLIMNRLTHNDKFPYSYYGAPYEAEADRLGGV